MRAGGGDLAVTRERLQRGLAGVAAWVEGHEYRGYEPFDGLSSFLRPLTFGSLFLDRALMQVVRRCPVNLRPLLGIRPLESTIGRGYMAWGYLRMLAATGDAEYGRKARACLAWLMANTSAAGGEYAWGKHFDFASRAGRYPKLEPITVWTSLIGMAFLEAYEILGEPRYLEVARSTCRWIAGIARRDMDDGAIVAYTASGEPSAIHNHNMLAAGLLAGTARHAPDEAHRDLARRLVAHCCAKQHPDGGWYYGEEPMYHWIDNFHTGYNLDGLQRWIDATGDTTFAGHLHRGLRFYVEKFFEADGRPKYYHDRTFPVDSQCISQSIDTLAGLADVDADALPLAAKVADWALEHMRDRRGFFHYRQYPRVKDRTPMLHWAQATMYKALVSLAQRLPTGGGDSTRDDRGGKAYGAS